MAKFKTVASFTFPIEAYLAKGRLEAEGIPALVAHENHVWANWMYSQALGGVKLQVLENNVEAANLVLEKHLKGAYESDLDSEFPDIEENHCPQCEAKQYESRLSLFSLITVLLTFGIFAIIFPLRKKHHKCRECGFNWKY